jgi:ABC-type lipoprotein release transport system permease subunit
MIFSVGFMNGMNQQMVENTINTSLGHVAIHQKGFQDDPKLKHKFVPSAELYKKLNAQKNIIAYSNRVKLITGLQSAEDFSYVQVVGIDPEQERKISMIESYTSKEGGSQFLKDSSENKILISKVLADKLDVLVGEKIELALPDKENELISVGVRVQGFFQTPVDSFDKLVVFVGIKMLQEKLKIGEHLSEITILSKDKMQVDKLKSTLIKDINDSNLEILSWKDMAPSLVSAVELFDKMMYIFFMIIFVTVIFSIANTLIMAIMERFHEIGVMKSIGTRPKWIFFMIIFEAINLGLVGVVVGVGGGMLLNLVLSYTGINLSFYMETMRMWGSGSIIYPVVRPGDIIMCFAIVMVVTLVAALYPAQKAARIKPLEALNYI